MKDPTLGLAGDPRQMRSSGAADPLLPVYQLPADHSSTRPRESIRIPRIAIDVFWDSPQVAASLDRMAADRMMAPARVNLHKGGIAAAISRYEQAPTPNLVVVEGGSSANAFLVELDRLAEVCDAGTKVLALGHINDIVFYRSLLEKGVSDYMLAPVDPIAVIEVISRIYGEGNAEKLGQVYAFIGARGGTGSSTIAHNVAWTIARRFSSGVVLADMDLPFGTAGLDFNLDTGQGVGEAIKDVGRLDQVLFDRLLMKCGDNLSLLSAPAELTSSYDLDERAIEKLLEVARSSAPFIILDMPHLWTKWSKNTLIAADEIVITVMPDLASLRNAKNLIEVLRQARPHDPPPKLVLNQVGVPKRPEIKSDEFAKALQLQPLASIPFDANLFGTAANKGRMIADISTKGPVHKAISLVAEAVTGRQEQKSHRMNLLGTLFTGMKFKSGKPSGKKAK